MVPFPQNQQFLLISKEMALKIANNEEHERRQIGTTTDDDARNALETSNMGFDETDLSLDGNFASSNALMRFLPSAQPPQPLETSHLRAAPPLANGPLALPPVPPPPPRRVAAHTATDTETPAPIVADNCDVDPRVQDETYESALSGLVQCIHKSNSDWMKKQRELTLLCSRLKGNNMTKDSEVLRNLQDFITQGKDYDAFLQGIEEKFALMQFVDHTEQSLATKRIAQIADIIKECNKIKLPITIF